MDIEILILSQLMQGPKHGYEIKKSIIFVMGNQKIINNNALYPKLKQFEARGIVSKELELQEGKPNRYVYSLTKTGHELFYESLSAFTMETITIDDEWSIRLAYYDLLTTETKRRMLDYREQYILEKMNRLEQLSTCVGDNKYLMYSPELYLYTQGVLEKEMSIIHELLDRLEATGRSS